MVERNQIARLRKDSQELGHYIHKLNKKGNADKAYKIAKRQSFLNQVIESFETSIAK